MRSRNSSGVRASRNCTLANPIPPSRKCTCESLKPGVTRLPCRSITFVFAPIHLRISSVEPTAAMRLPRTATASTSGCLSSTVQIFPLTRTRSAGACARTSAEIVNVMRSARNFFIGSNNRFQGRYQFASKSYVEQSYSPSPVRDFLRTCGSSCGILCPGDTSNLLGQLFISGGLSLRFDGGRGFYREHLLLRRGGL